VNTEVRDSRPLAPDFHELARHAEDAAALLKALANRNRLMVLCVLHDGELSVSELNQRIPLSQSALSQHLATLRREGLVETRRDAQIIYYRLSASLASSIIALLHAHYCGPSGSLPAGSVTMVPIPEPVDR
jgi:DNA-binding transcriptional ArsR family regulator